MPRLTLVAAALFMMLLGPLRAPAVVAQDAISGLPPSVHLDGLTQIWQQRNRCASAALSIQLSYFDWGGTYADAMQWLSPSGDDVSVRLEEMAAYAEDQGLRAIIRTGGTIDLLRGVVAAGFPVLVENVYYDGPNGWQDWMSHNRVLVGYDDAAGILYFYDSLLGNGNGAGRPMEYADFDERWRPFNRDFLVLYRPEDEDRLIAALGSHWDAQYNAEWTLHQAQADLAGPHPDSFSDFNVGEALVALGRYEEAASAFDDARALGLPWRMLWYQFGPFEAYLAVGRYQDVVNLVYSVLNGTRGVEEMYYYIGRAYEGLGNPERAASNYEVAVTRNPHFVEAAEALAALKGTQG